MSIRQQLLPMMSGLSGDADVRSAVRALAGRNVDVVKVMATGRAGMLDTDPLKRELTDDELAAAVAEAKSAGLAVAAHAHTDEAARAAVLAGVRTIEHGTLLSEETSGNDARARHLPRTDNKFLAGHAGCGR